MEHFIIDPVDDADSDDADIEDTVGGSPIGWDLCTEVESKKRRSLLEHVGVVLGITRAGRGERHSRGNVSGFLSRDQAEHPSAEGQKLLSDAEERFTEGHRMDTEATESGARSPLLRATTLMRHVTARSKAFVVIMVSPVKVVKEELQTQDILSRIHKHNKENQLDDMAAGALRVRDLRLFLSSGRSLPSIVARRNCLLVSLPYVRMIIMHALVWLIPIGCNNFPRDAARYGETEVRFKSLQSAVSSGGGSHTGLFSTKPRQHYRPQNTCAVNHRQVFCPRDTCRESLTRIDTIILQKLEHLVQMHSNTPFEYLALETALVDSSDVLRRQLRIARYTAYLVCTALRRGFGVTAAVLVRINALRKIVNTLKQEVNGVVASLNDALGDDETLRRLAISELWDEPQLWEAGQSSTTPRGARRTRLKHEIEMLLECYSQEGDIMLKNVMSIEEYIDDSLAMVDLHLAMQRNFLLKADVWMTTLATAVGFFALVPGCFGMNIKHGFERTPSSTTIFWSITGAIFLATLLTGITVCFFLKNLTI